MYVSLRPNNPDHGYIIAFELALMVVFEVVWKNGVAWMRILVI